jgi:hypothetical protein
MKQPKDYRAYLRAIGRKPAVIVTTKKEVGDVVIHHYRRAEVVE